MFFCLVRLGRCYKEAVETLSSGGLGVFFFHRAFGGIPHTRSSLRGLDIGFADIHNAFLDFEFGGLNISEQFGGASKVNHILGGDVAVDFPLDNTASDFNFGFYAAGFSDDEISIGGNIALKGSFNFESVFKFESALKLGVLAQSGVGLLIAGTRRRDSGRGRGRRLSD